LAGGGERVDGASTAPGPSKACVTWKPSARSRSVTAWLMTGSSSTTSTWDAAALVLALALAPAVAAAAVAEAVAAADGPLGGVVGPWVMLPSVGRYGWSTRGRRVEIV